MMFDLREQCDIAKGIIYLARLTQGLSQIGECDEETSSCLKHLYAKVCTNANIDTKIACGYWILDTFLDEKSSNKKKEY